MKEDCPKGDDVGQLCAHEVHHGFFTWLGGLLGSKCVEMANDQVVGCIYGTFEENEAEARKFWLEVSKGGVSEGSVAQVLSDVLTKSREQSDSKKRLKAMQLYGVAVRGWNSFREGREVTTIVQPLKKPVPEIVA